MKGSSEMTPASFHPETLGAKWVDIRDFFLDFRNSLFVFVIIED